MELYEHRGVLPTSPSREVVDVPIADALALPMPAEGTSVGGRLSYHIRAGGHDVLAEDWAQFLAFADEHVGRAP